METGPWLSLIQQTGEARDGYKVIRVYSLHHCASSKCIGAAAWDFQQFDILTSVVSGEPLQPSLLLSLETPNAVQSAA